MKTIKNLLKNNFSTLYYFYSQIGNRIFIIWLMSVFIGILDSLGLTMFLPLLKLSENQNEDLGFLGEFIHRLGIKLSIETCLVLIVVFFSIKGFLVYFFQLFRAYVLERFIRNTREKFIKLFNQFPFKNYITTNVGRIQNSFTGDITSLSASYQSYIEGFTQLLIGMVYLSFVFFIDWKFALFVVVSTFFMSIFYKKIYKKTKEKSKNINQKMIDYQGRIIQYVTNFKYLKSTGKLNQYSQKLIDDVKLLEKNNIEIRKLNILTGAFREPSLVVVICLVICFQIFILKGSLSAVLVSLMLLYRTLGNITTYQDAYNSFNATFGSLDNIQRFEKELAQQKEIDGKISFTTLSDKIKIQNLTFGFNDNYQILKNISLEIPKNKSIALVGESGSGKTTLINLITGLLPPNQGEILIDQSPINQLKKSDYQQKIGYISQEAVIFNDSIFANVTFWAEKTPENIQKFQKAIQQASLESFINDLPEKENTLLGNNGINLSGGQRQRISIARELFKDIEILILDEATSALDSETESKIQKNIDDLSGKYTIIIIAHRLSTIKNADMIYLMNQGEIIDSGTFQELISTSKNFKKMVELQEL